MAREAENGFGGAARPWRVATWGIGALLLLLPLVAMQFTDEVKWTGFDFVFAGCMIGGVGGAFELAVRMTRNTAYRTAVGIILAAAFLLIWINGAVGIIGDEDNALNLLYGGVLLVAFSGAISAGFRAPGMARAMNAAAVAQALMGVVAVVAGGDAPPGAIGLVVVNGFFVVLFAGSALLFRQAAREQAVTEAAPRPLR